MTSIESNLSSDTQKTIISFTTELFDEYIYSCCDVEFFEFFKTNDLTKLSFFSHVMYLLEERLPCLWTEILLLISNQTKKIQKAILKKGWIKVVPTKQGEVVSLLELIGSEHK